MADVPERRYETNEDADSQSSENLKKENRKRQAKGWVISLTAAVIIALALRFFVFEFVRVDGESMQPALYKDEFVLMERVSYWFSAPQRGDIVVCSFPNSSLSFIKRVIGLPGDSISVSSGVLYINGAPDHEYFGGAYKYDMDELTVPNDCVMVMGDNRNDSLDSREPIYRPYSI